MGSKSSHSSINASSSKSFMLDTAYNHIDDLFLKNLPESDITRVSIFKSPLEQFNQEGKDQNFWSQAIATLCRIGL